MLRGQTTTHDAVDADIQDRTPRPGPASQQIIDELMLIAALLFTPEQRQQLAKMIQDRR